MALLELPLDVLVNIIINLNGSDLRNLMLCCKTLRDIIKNENSIWRSISRNKLTIHNRANRQSVMLSCYNLSRISHNWCQGIYRNKVVIYHDTNYMPWLTFYNSNVLVLSVGSELRCYPMDKRGIPNCKDILWKMEVPIVTRNDVRTNDISRFIIKHDYVVCGNRDGCVAVYKLENIKCRPHLLHHIRDCHSNGQLEVTAVELVNKKDKSYIITASDSESKLCFWCIPEENESSSNGIRTSTNVGNNTYDSIKEINLSSCFGMRCLASNSKEDKVAVGLNGNSKPLLVDVTTGQSVMAGDATKNAKDAVRDIGWNNENTIMFVTHSGKLQLVDVRTGAVVYNTMDPFQSTLYCVKSDGHYALVVGSSEYSRCVLYDWRSGANHVQMYFTQKKSSPIYCLDFDTTKLIAAADRSIAALSFNINASTAQIRDYSHTFEFINR